MAAKHSNGANSAAQSVSSAVSFLHSPTATPFLLSQKMALEATRFWARRVSAYAEQMQALATCKAPAQFADVQTRFFERLREDYASETVAVAELLTPAPPQHDAVVD